VVDIQQQEEVRKPGKRRWTIRRVEPKDQCHSSDKASGLLTEFNRIKRALRAKTYALQDWFRNGIRMPMTEATETGEVKEDSKVLVTVYLEDPGGHTHCATKGYQMTFDTQKERPKHFFWKKLVRTFRLKGLFWEWQRKISETDWATLRELIEPENNATYRVFIKGKRDKHANRPGKGRRAQRKRKNFQGVWRPPAEHNVNVGTWTRGDGNVTEEKVSTSPMRDTRPRITVERRNRQQVAVESQSSAPSSQVIGIALKPELVQMSEEGTRKLADSRMRDWACDQERYEEELKAQVEERRLQALPEEATQKVEICLRNGGTSFRTKVPVGISEDDFIRWASQLLGQEVVLRDPFTTVESQKKYVVWTKEEAARREQEARLRAEEEAERKRLEAEIQKVEICLWNEGHCFRFKVPVNAGEEDLIRLASVLLNEEAALKDPFTPVEEQKRYEIGKKCDIDRHKEELVARKRRAELAEARRQAVEEEARLKAEKEAQWRQAEAERVQKAVEKAQEQYKEEQKLRAEKRAEERRRRAMANWGKVATRYVEIQGQKTAGFKARVQLMKQEVRDDLQRWRRRLSWDDNGQMMEPPIPTPETEDLTLREWWQDLWNQERGRTLEEEEEIRQQHLAELERQRQAEAEEEAKRVQMLPENRTTEEILDELVELRFRGGSARKELLRKEFRGRSIWEALRRPPEKAAAIREEILKTQQWLKKYEKLEDCDKLECKCWLSNLQRPLKIAELKEEQEAKVRREKAEQKQVEIEREARRQKAIQEAREKERIRREAEAKLEREVKFRFTIWRLQTKWTYEWGQLSRKDRPIPPFENPGWRAIWDKCVQAFKEEDEADAMQCRRIAEIERVIREQRTRRARDELWVEPAKKLWLKWLVEGPRPWEKWNKKTLETRLMAIDQWVQTYWNTTTEEVLQFHREISDAQWEASQWLKKVQKWEQEKEDMREAMEWWLSWLEDSGPHPVEKTVQLDAAIDWMRHLLAKFDAFDGPDAILFKEDLREELLRGERRKEEETAMKAREEEESGRGKNTDR
jgi:hypothetical protein